MPQSINPGQKINVKIVKRPTNAAARKTLVRLLNKDADAQREQERLRRARDRHANPHQRSGRIWVSRVVKQRPLKGEPGESGTLQATPDVLRDLGSVERFVEVEAA